MSETLNVLKRARELISDEERWTQGVNARGRHLARVQPQSPQAQAWCAAGAIFRVASDWREESRAYSALRPEIEPYTVSHFNDTHSHAEVLARFDTAIAKLEEERST